MSPYLFDITHLYGNTCSYYNIYQVKANNSKTMGGGGRYGPQFSLLLFSYDLFAEASIEQSHCVMHHLDIFRQKFVQKINTQKI